MKKISIVTFVPVKPGFAGPSNEALAIAKYLYAKKALGRIICPDYEAEAAQVPERYFYTPLNKSFYKFLNFGVSFVNRFVPFATRRIREELFDLLISRSSALRSESADVLLFLKPVFPKVAVAARKKGFKTVGYASILHPKFNLDQVQKEQERFSVHEPSSYIDQKRVRNLSRFFDAIDHLLVESKIAQTTFLEYGIQKEKIHFIGNISGVDCQQFSPGTRDEDNDTFKVLHISHMNLIKGIGYLFEAWKTLGLESSKLLLGGNVDKAVDTIFKRMSPINVIFLGSISNTTEWYRKADVFVSPSVSDKGPYTVLEAMACGVPVIVSNMCGLSSIINHGEDGFIYQYNDVEALKRYILWCYQNRDRLKEMGKLARKKALQYQQNDFAHRLVEAIMQVTSQEFRP